MHTTIGEHLRKLRKQKNLSQKQVGERTGLPQSYLSLVENGHTKPGIQTLEKLTRALGIQLYELFHDAAHSLDAGDEPVPVESRAVVLLPDPVDGIDRGLVARLQKLLGRIGESDRQLLFSIAEEMANR